MPAKVTKTYEDGTVDLQYLPHHDLFHHFLHWSANGTKEQPFWIVYIDGQEVEYEALKTLTEDKTAWDAALQNGTLHAVHYRVSAANVKRKMTETVTALRNEIASQLQGHRSDTVPGFLSYTVFQNFVKALVQKKWAEPSQNLFLSIVKSIDGLMKQIFSFVIQNPRWNRCHNVLKSMVAESLESARSKASTELESVKERETRPHTLNHYFYSNILESRVRMVLNDMKPEIKAHAAMSFAAGQQKQEMPMFDDERAIHSTKRKLLGTSSNSAFEVYDMENMLSA